MNGRISTSEEFASAKASGDFDSEGEEKEVDLEWYTDFSYEVTGPNEVTITYYQMDKELIMTNLNGADLGNNHCGLVLNQWTDWSGSIGESALCDFYLNGES